MRNRRRFIRSLLLLAAPSLLLAVGCSRGESSPEPAGSTGGTLVKSIGRNNDGSTLITYHLKTKAGWIRLHGQSKVLESQAPNTHVLVEGSWSPDHTSLDVRAIRPDPKAGAGGAAGPSGRSLSTTAPKGKVAIFLIKDSSLSADPFPKQTAIDNILQGPTSTNAFYQETSYGAYGLTGDVFGWYTADISSCASFDAGIVGDQIEQLAAAQDHYVTDDYRHAIHIYVRPGDTCFLAYASLGSPDGIGAVQSFSNSGNTIAHELGHNLGLHHASSLTCRDSRLQQVPYGARCQFNEYDDPYDAMGFDGLYYQFNGYSRSLEGWLAPERQQRVTAAGAFTIQPIETAVASGLQSLLVPIPGTSQAFHVEMRKQFGFDSVPRFDGAVLVRVVQEPGLWQFTDLLDMSPDQNFDDSGLQVGQTFQDPLSGISITLSSKTASQAVINVAFGGPSCSDGVKNGTETGVDCGGVCAPCSVGQTCLVQRDCNDSACSPAQVCVASTGGLTGYYYTGQNFDTLTTTEVDKFVDFDWGGGSPAGLPPDHFSVRWLGKVVAPETATYTFHTETDDGVRLWVNNQLVIDHWVDSFDSEEGTIALTAGQQYDLRMDYYENGGGAHARLMWSSPTIPLDLIPPTQLIPAPTACTAATASDLGPRTTPITVPSNACVKASQYPSWWSTSGAAVMLQSGGTGTFPVPATWQDACTSASDQVTFTTFWQTQSIGMHAAGCPAVIQLKGDGSPLQLTWW